MNLCTNPNKLTLVHTASIHMYTGYDMKLPGQRETGCRAISLSGSSDHNNLVRAADEDNRTKNYRADLNFPVAGQRYGDTE